MEPKKTVRRVYISEPLTGVPNVEEEKAFVEEIGHLLAGYELEAYIPHISTDPLLHADISPEEVYNRDRLQITRSDAVLIYGGWPSHGVGMEAEIAHQLYIPVILMFQEDRRVSRMLRGIPALWFEVTGKDKHQLLRNLEHQLMQRGVIGGATSVA